MVGFDWTLHARPPFGWSVHSAKLVDRPVSKLTDLRTTHHIYYVNIVKKQPREIRFAHLTLQLAIPLDLFWSLIS